ncbi:MAG: radical SAM protein [bacterium]
MKIFDWRIDMKIRLVEPAPAGVHVFSKFKLPRLGLPMIGASLIEKGHDVIIYVLDLAPVDWDDLLSADLVGFSATTSTVNQAYDMADRLRLNGVPVIIGGPHVTFMIEEALRHVDYVAVGEQGNRIMLELIAYLGGKGSLETIPGISYKRKGVVIHNPIGGKIENLDDLPFPDLTLIKNHQKITTTPIMTSWGCPFDCNFCSVTAMFGKKYRYRSAEKVIEEIKSKRATNIFFYDDNLAANTQRLKILLKMMIDQKLRIRWSAQMRIDVVRDLELLDLMSKSGAWLVYLGLESVSQATLNSFHKSQKVEEIIRAVELLHQYGIGAHGMFVLGADTDQSTVVKDTVDFALKYKLDTIMPNILTPLPGTELYQELESRNRIFDNNWNHYDAHHVVFRPKNMSPYELQNEIIKGYVRFYALRRVISAVFTLQKMKIALRSWGYSTVRAWRKDDRNKKYLKSLKRLRLPKKQT